MASISCGIIGLPNVGKSTLFNALTGNAVLAANYPFATIEPNTGIVPVPDTRLQKLAELYKCNKIVPATVTFVDVAGLVAGASNGEGLGNQFLSHVRQTNAIVHVVRAFDDKNVTHIHEQHDPRQDIDIINTELVLADLQTVTRKLPRIEKEARTDAKLKPFALALDRIKNVLNDGAPAYSVLEEMQPDIRTWVQYEFQLLTGKPMVYLFNVDETTLIDREKQQTLATMVTPARSLFICAKLESELKDLDEADARELLLSYGVNESGLLQLIHTVYETLGLQSYLTAGPQEIRAWTIPQNATAPQAAGAIHSDFEKGFIAAQIVAYPDLIAAGSESAAKAAGKIRTEGKNYVMQPDDIVEFRFNVTK